MLRAAWVAGEVWGAEGVSVGDAGAGVVKSGEGLRALLAWDDLVYM